MKVMVVKPDLFAVAAAGFFMAQVLEKPRSCIGLAGGNTTIPIHRAIVEQVAAVGLDTSGVRFFNVDEYAGAAADEPGTCRWRLMQQLLLPLKARPEQICLFRPNCEDPQAECWRVREEIGRQGGIDLQYLGIGANGHIGFNQPGTPLGSTAYSFPFEQAFREEKSSMFGSLQKVPCTGMTLGLKDCMQSRRIVLVANDSSKATALRRIVCGPVTPEVPASVLQLHPDTVLLATPDAAEYLPLTGNVYG